jgi:nucleoside-diphosphate-sugar epimerase
VRYGEVAETVRKIIPDSRITFGRNLKRKAQEPLYLNIDRLKKEFGFKHEFNLENGIRDYIHWIRNGRY